MLWSVGPASMPSRLPKSRNSRPAVETLYAHFTPCFSCPGFSGSDSRRAIAVGEGRRSGFGFWRRGHADGFRRPRGDDGSKQGDNRLRDNLHGDVPGALHHLSPRIKGRERHGGSENDSGDQRAGTQHPGTHASEPGRAFGWQPGAGGAAATATDAAADTARPAATEVTVPEWWNLADTPS